MLLCLAEADFKSIKNGFRVFEFIYSFDINFLLFSIMSLHLAISSIIISNFLVQMLLFAKFLLFE